MNTKTLLGFALAFLIGIVCRLAAIPLPAPPVLIGALLVVAMTLGYGVIDRLAVHRANVQRAHCGGPTGETRGKSS
ncbi:XapX domain-containing protein [Exilibacterium tricleocarpae]|uniref:XapX domain-containing protein n=1 Tax=Exilibacterium tricleocarpae TaxID=2591008 RepID=A0A545UBF5_9GAMM|nr:DUF1427 family protein [Exilibacterium tricleocarpae]TQV86792.1 XapX domain-containing protein [Exilibacterium tricleocarpae]